MSIQRWAPSYRVGVDAGFGLLFAFWRPWPGTTQYRRWARMRSVAALLLALFLCACDSNNAPLRSEASLKTLQADYDATLEQATNTIPYAAEFRRLFPQAGAYWSYYTSQAGRPTLNMEALLFDRYQLTMQVRVTFQPDRRKIQGFAEPEWLLVEISEVGELRRVGTTGAVTNLLVGKQGDRSLRFGAVEWRKVVEGGGDFSPLGFPLVTNSPAPGFQLLRADWNKRMKREP